MIPEFDQSIVAGILRKFGRDKRAESIKLPLLTFDTLYGQLNAAETAAVKKLLSIEPKSLGFKGPFVTFDDAAQTLRAIGNQAFNRDGSSVSIETQYLGGEVYKAFMDMKAAIKNEIDSNLMVESGYRSPAHQVITFFTYLEIFEFDIFYVASGVALPGYSQHSDPVNTALDVINENGIPTDQQPELFAETAEYAWLLKNAGRFGFKLSYPQINPDGVKFEPWHWRYCP